MSKDEAELQQMKRMSTVNIITRFVDYSSKSVINEKHCSFQSLLTQNL